MPDGLTSEQHDILIDMAIQKFDKDADEDETEVKLRKKSEHYMKRQCLVSLLCYPMSFCWSLIFHGWKITIIKSFGYKYMFLYLIRRCTLEKMSLAQSLAESDITDVVVGL